MSKNLAVVSTLSVYGSRFLFGSLRWCLFVEIFNSVNFFALIYDSLGNAFCVIS